MLEFLKFVIGWLVLMGIIVVIALITPKIAPKIDNIFKSFKGKKEIKNPYDVSDELVENEIVETSEKE
jgi:hypothetical protein